MAKKFEPKERFKMEKDGKTYVLDKDNCKIKCDPYRATTFEDMVNFLKENGTDAEKEEFKKACYLKKVYEVVIGPKGGKSKVATGETVPTTDINVLYAKEWFFTKFAPEYLPTKKEKEKKPTLKSLLDTL